MKTKENIKAPSKAELLNICLNEKGQLTQSFKYFHNYSVHNMLWLAEQMRARKMKISPVKTYVGWQKLNRQVQRGSKAFLMTEMRVYTDKNKLDDKGQPIERVFYPVTRTHFSMVQTDGIDNSETLNEYNNLSVENVLNNLNIKKVDFECLNGNVQGYAKVNENEIAINPLDPNPLQTLIHEVAHKVLHQKDCKIKQELKEVEAEATCYIVCASIDDRMDLSSCRAYVQSYLKRAKLKEVPEYNTNRIFQAVDIIFKASDNNKDKLKTSIERLKNIKEK